MANIARQSASVLSKVLSGGGNNYGIPSAWSQSLFGSGWPITPVTAPKDTELPRTIDYPVSVNATLAPRTGYGLMPFASLLEAYENVAECKSPVLLIQRELNGFVPHLVDADGNTIEDHPYNWMTKSPDRKVPFGVWLTRFIKSTKVYDAPAVYLQRDNGGKIDGLHYIDGSTLFVIVDQFGNTPAPEPIADYVRRMAGQGMLLDTNPIAGGSAGGNSSLTDFVNNYTARQSRGQSVPTKIPAYTQVIKGTPFSWWSSDDVWYMPQSRRMNAPYGESFIEMAWSWIMIIVNVTAFELGHYRTGNMPEGFVTVPRDLFGTTDAILAAEMLLNQRMTSNPATERNRIRVFPDGSKYFATKKPDFPEQLYQQAWKNILNAIGIPASEFGEIPGAGLGGKGFKEGASSDFGRRTLNPHRDFVASLFNKVLEQDGVDDAHFSLDYALEEIDPDKKRASIYEGMAHGTLSLNDALGELNLNPVGDPDDKDNVANKHLIVAGATIYVIEDMETQNGLAVPLNAPAPGGTAGGLPVDSETAVEQDGKEHDPKQDAKTLQTAIKNMIATGTLDGKYMSVPSGKVLVKAEPPPAEKLAKFAGVDPEDDEYYGAPVSREIPLDFPSDSANGVEIVALCPDGLPPKTAIWKAEGNEDSNQQALVGGNQFQREEAAYLLDRSFGFMLVPLAYVAELNDELGSVAMYAAGSSVQKTHGEFDPSWLEKAAVFDHISGQLDRGSVGKNYLTHPQDDTRPVLYDNGMTFAIDANRECNSGFCNAFSGQPLSESTMQALVMCKGDASAWTDISNLVGKAACDNALARLQGLMDTQMLPRGIMESVTDSDGSSGL